MVRRDTRILFRNDPALQASFFSLFVGEELKRRNRNGELQEGKSFAPRGHKNAGS